MCFELWANTYNVNTVENSGVTQFNGQCVLEEASSAREEAAAHDSRGIAGNSQAKVTSDSSRRINTVQEGRDANLCVEYVAPEEYVKVAAEADDTIIKYFTEEETVVEMEDGPSCLSRMEKACCCRSAEEVNIIRIPF